jgi:hypothetical protein
MTMKREPQGCACECHQRAIPAVHGSPCHRCVDEHRPRATRCDEVGDGRRSCPPPEVCPQPGTVDVPGAAAAPVPRTSDHPAADRPAPGSPEEIPWFKQKVHETIVNGPTFGPRIDEHLPYLLMRSTPADQGQRPMQGVFWESPDIFVAAGLDADTAPLRPPTTAGIARAAAPNTLYAHVWNLGRAPAYRARVEFYWFNPSLGISQSDAHLIGATWVDLGNRLAQRADWEEVTTPYGSWLSRGSHAIVRCPVTWVPTYENGGHECLVVRVFEPFMDGLPQAQFSSQQDRHVAQRNIAVVPTGSPASIDMSLSLGYLPKTGSTEVRVDVEAPEAMDWIKVLLWSRTPTVRSAIGKVTAGVLPPTPVGARVPVMSQVDERCRSELLRQTERFERGCDPLAIAVHANAERLGEQEASVIRVRQSVAGDLVGGYTVVLMSHAQLVAAGVTPGS